MMHGQKTIKLCVMEFTIKYIRTGINIQDYKCYIWVLHSGEATLWYHVLMILCYILAWGYKHFRGTYSSIFSVAGRQYISYILLVPTYQTHYTTIRIMTCELRTHLNVREKVVSPLLKLVRVTVAVVIRDLIHWKWMCNAGHLHSFAS
jgi:hypothetical protein